MNHNTFYFLVVLNKFAFQVQCTSKFSSNGMNKCKQVPRNTFASVLLKPVIFIHFTCICELVSIQCSLGTNRKNHFSCNATDHQTQSQEISLHRFISQILFGNKRVVCYGITLLLCLSLWIPYLLPLNGLISNLVLGSVWMGRTL